ncbi:hydrocephalus-inducing protein homolog [Stegostoma tigrinum]|uniref:hydrocephalus-inducing protein homolog n=1 Tax=Stegostoma tigrinum TaxID=3053191 RepID=UPI002870AA5B|nr:hydrocephalus-inducing protein homolog [Stegostoma tigrinum]
MAASNVESSDRAIQNTFKLPEGFKSKVVDAGNPKLVKKEEKNVKLTPSAFMKEMSLDTKQRLANTHEMYLPSVTELLDMTETTLQKFSMLDTDRPIFQPFPSEIVFQNYEPFETCEVSLILRNHDQVPRMVKVIQGDSSYFRIICPTDVGRKVAPGMTTTFKLIFKPEENKDYSHELICVTEREKFLVPVKAIGARAILDFPDFINFSTCPVKYNTQKILLVRNIGKRETKFTLQTQKPFLVDPIHGNLEVGESIQVSVEFMPQRTGDHSEDLILQLDTGEDIFIHLYGAATDINVRLDKNSVIIEKTYISLANQRVVSICNRSDVIVHFQWKAFATPEEEEQQKIRFVSDLMTEEEQETNQFLKDCAEDPTLREQMPLLARTFQNRRQLVEDDTMLLSDDIFIIEPVEGDIWPNSTAEVNVICRPKEAKVYYQTVYCDITGRETRLPLRIKCEGLGPQVMLNVDQVEIGNVFINSKQTYELVMINKGDIPAEYIRIPARNLLASYFCLNPCEGILLPGKCQLLEVTFKAAILGNFIVDLFLSVKGNPEPVQVTFKGHVIGPTFHFNMPVLNFGEVSFGFPKTISCCLTNTSLVPMSIKLQIPGDGVGEISQTSFSQASERRSISSWINVETGARRKEFTINPSGGIIKSHVGKEIQVSFCPNTVKKYETSLIVEVKNLGLEALVIPIMARCIVPNVEVVNQQIDLGRCFVKHPYECMIKLQNTNDLPACYGLISQDLDKQHGILYSSSEPYGIIEACSTAAIPLVVEPQHLGELNTEVYIALFGKSQFPLAVHIYCIGEGPVVHLSSTKIDWGKIKVLTDVPKTICLSNESLIPARVTAKMTLENPKWRLEPSEMVIPPLQHKDLYVVAHLDDTIWSEDKVHLEVENSHTRSIHVQATGIGTTIVPNKPFGPVLNLGAIFSSEVCRYSVKLTNCGRRRHQIYWKAVDFPRIFKPSPQKQHALRDMKYRNSPVLGHYVPTFKVRPLRMDLKPGRSDVLMLEGESDGPMVVHGQLICEAIIGQQSGKQRIMKVNVHCEFIAPVLELSPKQLNFRVEKPRHVKLVPQYMPLTLKNISPLPLSLILKIEGPFGIVENVELETTIISKTVKLDVDEHLELLIQFDPSYKDDLFTRVIEEVLTIRYSEHPHVDYVVLRGEVHFPNLHFETDMVDFGCILNDTETVHYVEMINCSPLPVKYHWSFLSDEPIKWNSSPVCKPTAKIVNLETKDIKDETKLTNELPLDEGTIVFADSDRKMSLSNVSENDVEKTDAENETREGLGFPKEISSNSPTEGHEADLLSMNEAKPVPDKTKESKCLTWSCNLLQNNVALGVEQVFDILPLFGLLHPNESQQVTFTFYGHANIMSEVKAICDVEGGPAYQIALKGESSFIKYAFDRNEIDYGYQLFSLVAVAELTLKNTGKVGFDFTVLNLKQTADQEPVPGVPLVIPYSGYIAANSEQKLKVSYLPGAPDIFHKSFEIQVSHFEPESIGLKGEGIFPRIYLDLPRNIKGNEKYEALLKEAREALERDSTEANLLSRPETIAGELGAANTLTSYDTLLQMEADRLLIKECSLAQDFVLSSHNASSGSKHHAHKSVSRCHLPEFVLDFGFVILSTVKVHVVKITNTSCLPVSFYTDRHALKHTGFSTELNRVKNLPYCETETFEVRFEPLRANLSIGPTKALMSIQVVAGPSVDIILCATVTVPGLTVSSDHLDFGTVQCGQCQVMTIQLHNHLDVTCEWFFADTSIVKEKLDKHVPLYLRSKLLKELKQPSYVFRMLPACGVLEAGVKMNVQVTFIPDEEKRYKHRLVLTFAQSSHQVLITAVGQGLEPRLEFSTSSLELGPLLPYSAEVEGVAIVKNPCTFPIEFYSVEYDHIYLEEEKVLRMMKGYSSDNTLLLPPRQPGNKLPFELLDYYKEQSLTQEEQEQAKNRPVEVTGGENDRKENEVEELSDQTEKQERLVAPETAAIISESEVSSRPTASPIPEDKKEPENEVTEKTLEAKGEKPDNFINVGVGELEVTPVSMAIGRYLGLDLSPEGCAARNRRGIAIIVHGAPASGKTNTAVFLAKYYRASYLVIDSVLREAISSGTTAAATRARELCTKAALDQMLRDAEEVSQSAITRYSSVGIGGTTVEGTTKPTPEGTPTSEFKPPHLSTIIHRKSSMNTLKSSHIIQKQQNEVLTSQVSAIGPLMQQPMSITTSIIGEGNLMSCQLPEDVIVELLTERLQLNDCCQGIIFDGLESVYSPNEAYTLTAALKAISNRRHIYLINLSQEYTTLKAKEKAKQEEEEKKVKEQEKKERIYLQELSEEDYEALSEEARAEFDLKRTSLFKARRERVLKEIRERQLQQQRWREQLERLREEEELKKKSRRTRKDFSIRDDGRRYQISARMSTNISTVKSDAPEGKATSLDLHESIDRGDIEEGIRKKKTKDARSNHTILDRTDSIQEDALYKNPEKLLFQRFQRYERNQKKISQILEFWDRAQGAVIFPASEDIQSLGEENTVERPAPSGKRGKKDRHDKAEKERAERAEKERAEKDRLEREKAEKERLEKLREEKIGTSPFSDGIAEGDSKDSAEKEDIFGVPQIKLHVTEPEDCFGKLILESGKVPTADEVLNSLGLSRSGPPIPPPALFGLVRYPVERRPTSGAEMQKYFRLLPNPDEGKLLFEDKKEPEPDPEIVVPVIKEEPQVQHRGKSKKEKGDVERDKRRSGGHKRTQRDSRSSILVGAASPPSDFDRSSGVEDTMKDLSIARIPPYRWIVQPGEEVALRVCFSSTECGIFDQTLNFEILNTLRCYKLYCRGVSTYPTISQDPCVVFRHRKKSVKEEEIPRKKYIMNTGVFQFGPLLCGLTRERYKEGQYPENRENIRIMNTSPVVAEVSFCFEHDTKAATYLVDPPTMTLEANERKFVSIWAYPTSSGKFDDCLVCCIRENPEPVLFKICCYGVRAELELDRKQLHFDKMILHRRDTKSLTMRNNCLLPVAWRITGLESLGDDISLSQDQGIINPKNEFSVQMNFKAMRQVNLRKYIRLEVHDAENVLGIVQTENILILAEAYDVALDISFPKGTDGGIDFGIIKVFDSVKQTITLKNKGKYEIGYRFLLQPTKRDMPDLNSLFTIQPMKGSLLPNDRATHIYINFNCKTTTEIKEEPILRCLVIEPTLGDGGEIIASIPVKMSVFAIFTTYQILPAGEVNFGIVLFGNRKSRTFILENNCEFDFRYSIFKMSAVMPRQSKKGGNDGGGGPKVGKAMDKADGIAKQKEQAPQARLTVGMFTVFPGYGVVLPGAQQSITVDCSADQIGKHEELLCIDITDRDPDSHPSGIPYGLVIECCAPSIVVDDIASIFEEHHICQNINLHQCLQSIGCSGVYVEDEKKYLFHNVHVGDKVEARFKITNGGKVAADVLVSVKPVSNKAAARITDIFDVTPTRMNIPSYDHKFVVVTFTPQTMQNYQCIFEAVVEPTPGVPKSKSLVFDIVGDGNLPRINVLQPKLRNKIGNPLLIYSRLLLGQTEKLPVVLKNDGTLPAQVSVNISDDYGVFSLKECIGTVCVYPKRHYIREENPEKVKESCMLTIKLNSGEEAKFDVSFQPTRAQRLEGALYLTVLNNQFEDTIIRLIGEGFQDDITFDNIHGLRQTSSVESFTNLLEEKDIKATHLEHIEFGDCHIGKPYLVTFTMTNRSAADIVRFEWISDISEFNISPQFGHLHAGCAKDMTATFKSDLPVTYNQHTIKCIVSKITYPVPSDQVQDWDSRLSVVKWLNARHGVRPAKKKVVEVEPEPVHMVLEDSSRELELKISAMVDYSDFECTCKSIIFKDTMLYQSRVYKIKVINKGPGALEYLWKLVMPEQGRNTYHMEALLPPEEAASEETNDTASASVPAGPSTSKGTQAVSRYDSGTESISSWDSIDIDNPPFTVEPCSGAIAAMGTQEFKVKFIPLEVGEFEASLICSIPNLKEGLQGQMVAVKGRSLLPFCHFELEDSNYISGNRRNPELSGPGGAPPGVTLDPNTRVIEFQAVGVNTINRRSFYILNPTNTDYSFQWVSESAPNVRVQPAFFCLTEKGYIAAGKKTEVSFQFVPHQLNINESFWSFIIPEQNITVPFLLCGNTKEPMVSFDRSHINYKFVLLGYKAHETVNMINNEASPLSFHFRKETLHSEGYICKLLVEPMEGIVLPYNSVPIVFSCIANTDGHVSWNIVCDVKTKTVPLTLNIKMHGYSMKATVTCEGSDGTVTELSHQTVNEISFGEVELNDHINYHFVISNNGKFNFDFDWELSGPPSILNCLKLNCRRNTVETESSVTVSIRFHPDHKFILKDVELKLKIQKGPVFACILTGYIVIPSAHLSFTKYNFGPCFIYNAGMTPSKKTLIITNKQEQAIGLDCLFPNNSYLEVKFQPCALAPKKSVEAVIIFYPREPIKYQEVVTFEINGLTQQSVKIFGQGAEMKIEVVNHKDKVVDLQAPRVGQVVKKVVPIVNRSRVPLTFTLAVNPNQQLLQNPKVLSLSPLTSIKLDAQGGTCDVVVTFSPTYRIPQFAEEVMMECVGVSKPLFVIRGCCQGIEISLDQNCIAFGSVVLRSSVTRLIVLENIGDIGASFKWDVEKFKPHFSISPVEGYISPGMQVSLEVKFHPVKVHADIRLENVQCFIEGTKSLYLYLTGSCVAPTAMKEILNFSCQVRTAQVHGIVLTNRTNQVWNLQPKIEGEYWSGPKVITVQPHLPNQTYDITYKPLTMTMDAKKHQGSVFFPLPDGTGLLYMLQGIAEPPKAVAIINREVPCKTLHTVLLSIHNWLPKPQRFRATMDQIKPERLESTTMLKGLDYIDVPGSSRREYRLTFFTYKEAIISVKVTFRNETTQEYLYYVVNIKSTSPGLNATIELVAPVRQSTSGTVEVENPLTVPTVFTTECKITDISLPTQLIVPPQAKGILSFEYQPLKVGEVTGRLTLNNSDLGVYHYDLILKAKPAGLEKPLHFRTNFGGSQTLTAKFLNHSRQKVEYFCKVDSPEFLVEKSITVPPASMGGSEVGVEVIYEPFRLGESRTILNVTSSVGGEYNIPLFGVCLSAKPQGPFSVRAGSTASIPFKNIFPQITTYSFQVDNPAFTCKPSETLRVPYFTQMLPQRTTANCFRNPHLDPL